MGVSGIPNQTDASIKFFGDVISSRILKPLTHGNREYTVEELTRIIPPSGPLA